MPTYQYECLDCGYQLEILQSFTDKKFRKCPKCGKYKFKRLIGAGGGIIFKGTGFYETDYKKKSPPSPEPAKEQVVKNQEKTKTLENLKSIAKDFKK